MNFLRGIVLIAALIMGASASAEIVQMRYSFDYRGMALGMNSRKYIICDDCPDRETLKPAHKQPPKVPLAIKITMPVMKEEPDSMERPDTKSNNTREAKNTNETISAEAVQEKKEVHSKETDLKTEKTIDEEREKKFVVYFDFNSSYLNHKAKIDILRYVDRLKGKTVKVIGYTDHFGSRQYNNWLAFRRAKRVASVLIKNNIEVAEIKGLGKCCYTSNKDAENRRVEILIVKDKTNLNKGGSSL